MPIISHFYGIIIRMFFKDSEQHFTPHIHVKYAEFNASVDFDGNILAGNLPLNKHKLVVAWIEIHKEELIALWDLMLTTDQHYRINPLK